MIISFFPPKHVKYSPEHISIFRTFINHIQLWVKHHFLNVGQTSMATVYVQYFCTCFGSFVWHSSQLCKLRPGLNVAASDASFQSPFSINFVYLSNNWASFTPMGCCQSEEEKWLQLPVCQKWQSGGESECGPGLAHGGVWYFYCEKRHPDGKPSKGWVHVRLLRQLVNVFRH